MKLLNEKILKKIVARISDDIEGDWIIIGGTVLTLLGVNHRVTVDVDIISFSGTSNQNQLDLMNIADALKLPVETINQAGSFYLQKISGWQKMVILLRKGKKGSIFRPDLQLYFILKLGRLSISDMEDCLQYYKWSRKNEKVSWARIESLVEKEMKKDVSAEKMIRLEKLLRVIQDKR